MTPPRGTLPAWPPSSMRIVTRRARQPHRRSRARAVPAHDTTGALLRRRARRPSSRTVREAAIVEQTRGQQREVRRGFLDAAHGEHRVLLVRRVAGAKELRPSERQDGDDDGRWDSRARTSQLPQKSWKIAAFFCRTRQRLGPESVESSRGTFMHTPRLLHPDRSQQQLSCAVFPCPLTRRRPQDPRTRRVSGPVDLEVLSGWAARGPRRAVRPEASISIPVHLCQ